MLDVFDSCYPNIKFLSQEHPVVRHSSIRNHHYMCAVTGVQHRETVMDQPVSVQFSRVLLNNVMMK
jgi:hypothetical protein